MIDFHLYVNSLDSAEIHKNNQLSDFWVQLPKPYLLEGDWVCALKEITLTPDYKPRGSRLYLCCDLVEDTYVRNTLLPVLRNVEFRPRSKSAKTIEYTQCAYIKLKSTSFQRLRIYLLDQDLKTIEFSSSEELHCLLHFKRRWVL